MTARWPCFIFECLHAYRKYIIIFTPQACQLPNSQNYAPWLKNPTLETEATIFFIKINMEFSNKCECCGVIASAILNWHLESVSGHQAVMNDDPGVRTQKKKRSFCMLPLLWNCGNYLYRLTEHMSKFSDQILLLYALAKWPWARRNLASQRFIVLGFFEVGMTMLSSIKCRSVSFKYVKHIFISLNSVHMVHSQWLSTLTIITAILKTKQKCNLTELLDIFPEHGKG